MKRLVLALALAAGAMSHAHADDTQSPWGERGAIGHPTEIRSRAQLLAVAEGYVGSGKITRAPGPWCRDFVNLVAARAGVRLANHSRRAIDALGLGRRVADPMPGDLVVMRHHVTIYAGRDGGRIVGLGGNQGRRVRYSRYSPRQVVAFVRL